MIEYLDSPNAHEAFYDVDGFKIRLWIIVGGTPSLGFKDKEGVGITKRFETDPKLLEREGPLTFDILPNGEKDLISFVKEHTPTINRRKIRNNGFSFFNNMKAPIVTDVAGNKCIMRVEYRFPMVPYVKVDGDCAIYQSDLPLAWKSLVAILDVERHEDIGDLNDAEYWEIIKALNNCLQTGKLPQKS